MRSAGLHLGSMFVGALVACLALLTMAQTRVVDTYVLTGDESDAVRPETFVEIRGDEAYVVPAGKDLIFTAVHADPPITGSSSQPAILVDGVVVAWTGWPWRDLRLLPRPHIFAGEGSTVTWSGAADAAADRMVIYAYLVDAHRRERVVLSDANGPFTVPAGKVLVPTLATGVRDVLDLRPTWGHYSGDPPCIFVNGEDYACAWNNDPVLVFPRQGVSFPAGTVIELGGSQSVPAGEARLWGYLFDQ